MAKTAKKSCKKVTRSKKQRVGKKLKKTSPRKKTKAARAKAPRDSFRLYVGRVLRHIHPGFSLSGEAMSMVNSMLQDICQSLAQESQNLIRYSQKKTLGKRELQSAVKLFIPGKLGKHADFEGTKAIGTFTRALKASS